MDINILGREGRRQLRYKSDISLNAVKHGAYAKTKVLPHEDAKERERLTRNMYKDLKPKGVVEENLVDQMIDCLWTAERFKLRLAMRQENIFAQLTPTALAQMIEVPEIFHPYAPNYLKEPNTRFSKKELQLPINEYKLYLHLCKNTKGIANYQTVFNLYKVLFEGVHEYIGDSYGTPFILSTGAGLEIAWQNNSKKVEAVLLEYAASLWYQIHFDELRPHIRHAMATWFFLDRVSQKNSDYQDDLVVKELNRYKSLLDGLMKFRKVEYDYRSLSIKSGVVELAIQRNEMPDSESESTT
jgi:hypothetical protein